MKEQNIKREAKQNTTKIMHQTRLKKEGKNKPSTSETKRNRTKLQINTQDGRKKELNINK